MVGQIRRPAARQGIFRNHQHRGRGSLRTGRGVDPRVGALPAVGTLTTIERITCRVADLPVAKLWGGCSDGVTAYCATADVRAPERRVEDVQRMLGEGYRAVKFRFHLPDPREDLKVVEAVRAAVGDRIDIMVDANQAG